MSNEFNAKNGLKIGWGYPVSGITNQTIINNENSLATEGQIFKELTGKTDNSIFNSYTATTLTTNTENFVNISGDTMTGDLILPILSATSISATTFYGDGSNISGLPFSGLTNTGHTHQPIEVIGTAVTESRTINNKPLSTNITLQLDSIDFTNQGTTTTVLHGNSGGAPTFTKIVEDDISLSDNSVNDSTTSKHGFLPKLSGNVSQYINGQGNFAIPSGIVNSYTNQNYNGVTAVTVTHGFGVQPIVQCITSDGYRFWPENVKDNTVNDFTVYFDVPSSGTVITSVGSPQPQSLIVVTSNYTGLTTDRIIKVTTNGITITLPTAIDNTGREFVIKNSSSGPITVVGTGSETIDNEIQQILNSAEALVVVSDGTNYFYY